MKKTNHSADSISRCLTRFDISKTLQYLNSKLRVDSTLDKNQASSKNSVRDDIQPEVLASFDARRGIVPWPEQSFEFVKMLQEAPVNFGCVEQMRMLKTGSMVAVKRMPTHWVTGSIAEFKKCHPTSCECPLLDVAITSYLQKRKFPYICALHGVFTSGDRTLVVSELASKGDLFAWSKFHLIQAPGIDRERAVQPTAQKLFDALEWLHRLGIVHRDISLENILMDADDNVKLIDFGASSLKKRCRGACGKKPYQSPESHLGEHDGTAGDCFALGVTLFSLLMKNYPWLFTSPSKACQKYRFAEAHGIRKFMEMKIGTRGHKCCPSEVSSKSVLRLLLGLLDFDPSRRWHIRKLEAAAETAEFTDEPSGSESAWRLAWLHPEVQVIKENGYFSI